MKAAIVVGIAWLIMAIIRIPLVESWSILSDGSPLHWWNMVGIRVVIAFAFFEIAHLRRRLDREI